VGRPPTQKAGRKKKHGSDEGQKRPDRCGKQPEGEEEQPEDGVKDEGQERHWPAQYQQKAPQ
jgi:hypothetical protein